MRPFTPSSGCTWSLPSCQGSAGITKHQLQKRNLMVFIGFPSNRMCLFLAEQNLFKSKQPSPAGENLGIQKKLAETLALDFWVGSYIILKNLKFILKTFSLKESLKLHKGTPVTTNPQTSRPINLPAGGLVIRAQAVALEVGLVAGARLGDAGLAPRKPLVEGGDIFGC